MSDFGRDSAMYWKTRHELLHGKYVAALKREVLARVALEWQTIETMPKDGSRFLAWNEFSKWQVCSFTYHDFGDSECLCDYGGFRVVEQFYPTEWMPLPEPPVTA